MASVGGGVRVRVNAANAGMMTMADSIGDVAGA